MSHARRRLLKILAAVAVAAGFYTAASVFAVHWAATTRAKCALPCQELGAKVLTPPASKEDRTIHAPACQPLRLHLELHRPEARRGSRYALWYRATLTNQSCYRLSDVETDGFVTTLEGQGKLDFYPNERLRFLVWGPDGRAVPSGGFHRPVDYHHLYTADFAELERRKREGRDYFQSELSPGESVTTVPSILWPVAQVPAVDFTTGRHGIGYKAVPAPSWAETPPAGFKVLDAFVLARPGNYRIQAVFEDDVTADVILPYEDSVPVWLGFPVEILLLLNFDVLPDYGAFPSRWYKVRAESEPIEFVVPE